METKLLECIGQVLNLNEEEMGSLLPDDDLREKGLQSIYAIQLFLLIEEVFQFEIDDIDLKIQNVSSIRHIEELLGKYGKQLHE